MSKLAQIFSFLFLAAVSQAQISNLGTSPLTSGGATTSQAAAIPVPCETCPPNAIFFDYDNAGNQIRRRFIYVANVAPRLNNTNLDDAVKITQKPEENLLPSDIYHEISYYPNPVKEELYLSWELANNNAVTSIQIYDLNGRLLRTFQGLATVNLQTIPFIEYSAGNYLVLLLYSNGEQKTIKIIKK